MKHFALMLVLAVSVGMSSVVQTAPLKSWWSHKIKIKTTFQPSTCGNGVKTGAEQCDDGNAVNTDACLTTCKNATCSDGFVRSGVEECDDGNAVNTDACTNLCKNAKCLDGVVQAGVEECDDGNLNYADSCTNLCKNAKCGDGAVYVGVEECDDGNPDDTDACTNVCKTAKCGDGAVHTGVEECDDGNAVDTDSCSNLCKTAPQIFTVNSVADAVDDDPGKGGCHTTDNVCTLRAAVQEANTTAAADEIVVPAGTYILSILRNAETGQDTANQFETEGDLDIWEPVTIKGAGADVTTIKAGDSFNDRIFHSAPNTAGPVTIQDLTLDANHRTSSGRGGAVFFVRSGYTGLIGDCYIKNGDAPDDGGGVGMNDILDLVIKNSTVSGNAAGNRGGGLFCETGTCLVINSTFSNNTVTGNSGGGAIDNTTGALTIVHSTLVNNTVTDPAATGGGLRVGGAKTLSIKNTILAGNKVAGTAKNCEGDLTKLSSGGYNLSNDASCGLSGTGDQNSVAGAIVEASLAGNGGKTPTHLIPGGSPAIDLVPVDSCTDQDGGALTTDQRGVARPADGNKDAKALCDVGAVEMSN